MPTGEPVNLVAAIVALVVGLVLGFGLIVAMIGEVRRRKALLADGPDVSEYDRDIQRYTRRVWLMVAEWRTRLEPEPSRQLDEMWTELTARIDAFHAARKAGEETPDDVAALVRAEKEIDDFVAESRAD